MAKKQVETIEVKSVKGNVQENISAEQKLIKVSDSVGKIVTIISHDLVDNLVEVIHNGEKMFYGTYAEFKKGFKTSKLATSLLVAGILIKFSAVVIEGVLGLVGLDVNLDMAHTIADTAIGAGAGILLAEAGIKTFKGVRAGLAMSDDKLDTIKAPVKPWDVPFISGMLSEEESAEEALI